MSRGSRPFGGGTPRDVIAEALARRNGWPEIRPMAWTEAGAVLKALRVDYRITRKPAP